jgi:hypothetical protein
MQQEQAAPGQDTAGEQEPEEADCSVIADAEPDYGPPPLTVHFSVDSGESFAAASYLEVATGGQALRRALPTDYTHVRWLLKRPLPAGATALLRFRATLG